MALYATPGIIERVYYAVPGNYTSGEDFGLNLEAAVAAAQASIVRFEYPGQKPDHTFSRAFVDRREFVRWADGNATDRLVERVEIFLPRGLESQAPKGVTF